MKSRRATAYSQESLYPGMKKTKKEKKREKKHHEKSPSHCLLSGISTAGALDGAEGASLYT
jgi:hypothetical protein